MKYREIILPRHIRGGIRHRSKGFPEEYRMFAGDCETCEGHPISIQLADSADQADLLWVDQKTILPRFLKWMSTRLLRHRVNVCFFHNLSFDLTALLYDHLEKIDASSVTLSLHGTKWEILSGKIYYAKVKYKDGTVLHIIDSFRFYTTSLAKLGKSLKTRVQKGTPPAGLGKKKFTDADIDFVNYAKDDAKLGYEVGEHIIGMHKEFDVALSISAPQFAMRVFTKYHMREDEQIQLPITAIRRGALASYHGGKNGFYVKPGLYRNVSELDISSAYPHAMKSLPQFVKGFYKHTVKYEPGLVGVYCVTGTLRECRYAIFQTHEGKAIHGGGVKRLWVTSYELEEALRDGEFTMESCNGWLWVPDPDYDHNPLSEYVDVFYAKKEAADRGEPQYLTYKLLLNSSYGKFIQNVEVEENGRVNGEYIIEPDGRKTKIPRKHKAGGMFNPVIATLITGFVRAYLHRLEHRYLSIHSSTDSIKTLQRVDPKSLPHGLGGLNVEVTGDCIMLRNKLYLHYDGPMKKGPPKKYALHGFWGSVDDLLALVAGRQIHYAVDHLYRMREAFVQGKTPLKSYHQKREVNIDWHEYAEYPEVAPGVEAGTCGDAKIFQGIFLAPPVGVEAGGTRAGEKEVRPTGRSVLGV
jgi:hypothetical protein